ncbi:MAG: hypothetical protein HZB23_14425 [Deltaproteobacteria bacterium]|nr:hypothetical protein [Deltaproteobacteria bacterium]
MKTITVSSLRKDPAGQLAQVGIGEEVLLTLKGKIIAKLIPLSENRQPVKPLADAGPMPENAADAWRFLGDLRKKCAIGDVVSPLDEIWEANDGHS